NGYKVNRYDTKLQIAYNKYKLAVPQKPPGWIPIIDAGHGGMVDGQYLTSGKQYKFNDGTQIYEGVINRAICRKLADRLNAAGIPFFQTTLDTETDVNLLERIQKANGLYQANRNCYFLSVHCNSASNSIE